VTAVLAAYVALLAYFAALHGWHVAATLLAIPVLKRELGLRALQDLPRMYSGFEPPVSVLVHARDREGDIVAVVEALLQLDYPEYEVIVVNDGSDDGTLGALERAFLLEPFPEVYWRRLPTRPVLAIYRSRVHASLRVIDKERGGRADALNAGINASRYPLFCAVDDGATLHPQGLRRLVAPFLDDPATVAAGGTLRIANGSVVAGGRAQEIGLPPSLAGRLQVLEQLRATFQSIGRAGINAELQLAGALTVFRKDIVVETGGHAAGVFDERADLVARLHTVLRSRGERYAVRFVPETAGWIVVPETFAQLEAPRVRAQYALAESLGRNTPGFGRGGGTALAWHGTKLLESAGPLIEVAAFAFLFAMVVAGQLSGAHAAAFVAAVFSLGLSSTALAMLVEDWWLRQYPRRDQLAALVAAALAENLFYRPMVAVWRAAGTLAWIRARAAARRAQPA
jgi:cellulose synthase/poly-beta-1,6-N-acetylglucosamine synthase-like glycosyltransferase